MQNSKENNVTLSDVFMLVEKIFFHQQVLKTQKNGIPGAIDQSRSPNIKRVISRDTVKQSGK